MPKLINLKYPKIVMRKMNIVTYGIDYRVSMLYKKYQTA